MEIREKKNTQEKITENDCISNAISFTKWEF